MARTDALLAYDHPMRKRWILYLVLSLLVGRAWGLHLPSTLVQDAPCHGQAVHALQSQRKTRSMNGPRPQTRCKAMGMSAA